MEAAQEGHVDIVKYVLERGANVHAETSTQDTALTYACANGHTIIADILLQCGAHLVRTHFLPPYLPPSFPLCLCLFLSPSFFPPLPSLTLSGISVGACVSLMHELW